MSTWTAPATWVAGGVSAAQMNALRDNLTFLKGALDLITGSTTADTGTATYLNVVRPAPTGYGLNVSVTGDVYPRIGVRPVAIYFGTGAAVESVSLGLGAAAGRLEVDGTDAQLGVTQNLGGVARNQLFTWISGDTQPRIALGLTATDNGRIAFGTGSATPDFTIERDAAGRITATSSASGGARIGVVSDANETAGHFAWRSGDTIPRISIGQDGSGLPALRFSPGSGSAYESLYREAANNLVLTGYLRSERAAAASSFFGGNVSGDTGLRLRLTSTAGGRGAIFFDDGTAAAGSEDTNLYSSAVDVLKTDDTFHAVLGVATFVKAGAISDADWAVAPPIGTIAIDTTNFKVYIRTAAATWKSSAAFT